MPPAARKRFSRLPAEQPAVKSPESVNCRRSKRLQHGSPDSDLENNNPVVNSSTRMDISPTSTPTKLRNAGKLSKSGAGTRQRRSPTGASPLSAPSQRDSTSRSPDIPSLLLKAKSLFRLSALPPRLVGREQERSTIQEFLDTHVGSTSPASLYISGAPGTGKTALVEQLIKSSFGGSATSANSIKQRQSAQVSVVQFNCMAVGDQPKSIFHKILERIDSKAAAEATAASDCAKLVEAAVSQRSKKHWLILLDEIDQLLTRDQDVLYRIFEWPLLKQSKCSVIGIANALDLTQRFLPRLIAKNRPPIHIAFSPYTAAQITEIIINRLESLTAFSGITQPAFSTSTTTSTTTTTTTSTSSAAATALLMQRPAIELCARKVAATGDLRKALDICRQSIELMEREYRQQSLVGSPLANKTRENMPAQLPKVTVQHVLRVINNAFGAANPSLAKIRGLTAQQKMALIVLSAMRQRGIQLTVGAAYDSYVYVCRKSNLMDPLGRSQFIEIVGAIESTGLINMMGKVTGGLTLANGAAGTTTPSKKLLGAPAILFGGDDLHTPKQKASAYSSGGRLGTPGSATGRRTSAVKPGAAVILDGNSRLAMNVNCEEIRQGVQDVPFLMELMEGDNLQLLI